MRREGWAGHFTQEDPIGLAGGLNLYGYAQGDPVNFADPFGLCPDSLSSREREECEKKETDERELAHLAAVCRADVKQVAKSLLVDATGLGLLKYVRSLAMGVQAASTTTTMTGLVRGGAHAAVTPGVMTLEIADFAASGSPNPLWGVWATIYDGAKLIPVIPMGTGLELGEALDSCHQAAMKRARYGR